MRVLNKKISSKKDFDLETLATESKQLGGTPQIIRTTKPKLIIKTKLNQGSSIDELTYSDSSSPQK